MDVEALRSRLEAAGQSHLLQYWEGLSDSEKQALFKDLDRIDFHEVNNYFKVAEATLKVASEKIDDHLEPLSADVCGSVSRTDPATIAKFNKRGKHLLYIYAVVYVSQI